jgi:TolB-like protein
LVVLGFLFIPNLFKSEEQLEKSIAVLPFENLSSDEEQLWFSDGITDVIINQLSKISGLRVLGRTSTLKYRKEQKSISEIGAELEVNYLIEGTVQRQENKMRISVQLIRVINEDHLWSDLYDREWKDIFDVQSDIAQRIAEELQTVLTPEEKELIENSQTKNPEAYNLYLKGRFFWNKRTEEGFKKSVEYFEKSIAEDPDYALAYAGLADAYFLIAWYGWYSQVEGYARAKKFALRGLEIDKNLAEAHATLGSLISWSEWKWEEARKELLLAIKLNPNYIMAHSYYSELLDIFRQNDEARKQINFALELDPFFPVMHGLSGLYYYNEGKFEESLDEYQKVQELDPDNIGVYWRYFKLYLRQGENLKAIEALQKIMLMDTSTVRNVTVVKDVYNKSGVNGLLNWLIELQLKNPKTSPMSLATLYAMVNKKEEALDWLEKEMEERSPSIPRINNDPAFDNLRSEPRFLAIITKMGLSEYSKKE